MSFERAFRRGRVFVAGACALMAGGFAAADALAQETTVAKSTLGVGAAAVIKPKYEGSNEHEVIPIPVIIPRFVSKPEDETSAYSQVRKRLAFRGLDDIRIRVLGGDRFQVGAVTGWITKRDQDDGNLLKGMGDIDGGLVAGAYSAFRLGMFSFDAAYLEKLTGDSAGPQYRFGVETTQQITDRASVGIRVGTTFASAEYMQTYFGVTQAQSSSSRAGLPVYKTDGGIKDVFIAIGGTYDISDRWVFKGGARYGRLLDEAADSPVVQTADQVSGTVGLAYRFAWNR
ncbi:MAG: MipA/OmpV family protein [Methyloceanibacter sp.]|jgi:outer membrane protein